MEVDHPGPRQLPEPLAQRHSTAPRHALPFQIVPPAPNGDRDGARLAWRQDLPEEDQEVLGVIRSGRRPGHGPSVRRLGGEYNGGFLPYVTCTSEGAFRQDRTPRCAAKIRPHRGIPGRASCPRLLGFYARGNRGGVSRYPPLPPRVLKTSRARSFSPQSGHRGGSPRGRIGSDRRERRLLARIVL